MVTTSVKAFEFARKLCDEYETRKRREKEMNVAKEKKKAEKENENPDGPSRTVTQIDYKKHEKTVKELDRQEKEELFQKKKQEASQWCTLDHEHGPNCRRPVGGCSHDHQKEWAIYDKSTEEKVKAADRFREEGNEAYRKHNYGLAAVHYRKALLQFDYTFADNEEQERAVDAVKVPCLLNLAACKCQQEEWDEVLTQCRLALEINPRLVKAYYRTGLAHLARDHFELAKEALMTAHEIEPKNGEVLEALRRLKKNMDTYKVRTKEVARGMIQGGHADDDDAGAAASAEAAASPEGQQEEARALASPASPTEPPPAAVEDPPSPAVPSSSSAPARAAAQAPNGEEGAEREAHGQAVKPAPQISGELRRRRGATAAAAGEAQAEDADGDSDAEVDDEIFSASQRRMLNGILLGAVALAAISVSVVAAAYFSQTST